jgi:ATP-dependent protease HslVU (ClpYQ) peptidase subunit
LTCIVGLVHDGNAYLGGDSAGCSGWDLTVRADPKVFVNGSYVMGFTTSFRMGQLLRYSFTPPEPDYVNDLHRFMCTAFTDSLRQCLKDGGWAEKEKEREAGGTFLVGTHGRLFIFNADYQAGEPADPYAAVGCGAGYALGALHATEGRGMKPEKRLDAALTAAERFSNGVRGPFTHVNTAPAP